MSIQILKVIVSNEAMRGKGIEGNPLRSLTRIFNMRGELILEYDPYLAVGGSVNITEYHPEALAVPCRRVL